MKGLLAREAEKHPARTRKAVIGEGDEPERRPPGAHGLMSDVAARIPF